MWGNTGIWALGERGPSLRNELVRKLLRRWRPIPDFDQLRAQGMVIGRNVAANNNLWPDSGYPWLLQIGDDVDFAFDVAILTHDASPGQSTGLSRLAPVKIGSRVYFGARSIVLPGVTIGDDVVVGAGAVVAHDVPSGSVVAGVPARPIAQTAQWSQRHLKVAQSGPTWSRDELPVSYRATLAEQTQMLQMLTERGVGYVGRGRVV